MLVGIYHRLLLVAAVSMLFIESGKGDIKLLSVSHLGDFKSKQI